MPSSACKLKLALTVRRAMRRCYLPAPGVPVVLLRATAAPLFLCFFFSSSGDPRDLHSFPTRRSSDPPLPRDHAQREAEPVLRFCLQRARRPDRDRKSTRLNSSHVAISYAVFCLKK